MAGILDPNSEEDFRVVEIALERAKKEGLQIEVIVSALQSMRQDPTQSINECLGGALYDWDI